MRILPFIFILISLTSGVAQKVTVSKDMPLKSDVEDDEVIHRIRRYNGNMILTDSTELFRLPKTFKKKNFLIETSENKKFSILFHFEDKHVMEFYLVRHDSLDIQHKKILEVLDLDLRDRFKEIVLTDRGEIVILLEQKNSRFSKDENHIGLFVMDTGTSFKYTRINNYGIVISDLTLSFEMKKSRW